MMKKNLSPILSVGLVVFIGIQFIVPPENHGGNSENDIIKVHFVPENVHTILKKSCFNCHSNNTNYPWYTRIQPVRWWITGHITDGKGKLNFSDFKSYNIAAQYSRFKKIEENVKAEAMPLPSYLTTHPEGAVSEEEKMTLINWAKTMQDSLKLKYPMDSLEIKIDRT
jgi:Haem-binding domain